MIALAGVASITGAVSSLVNQHPDDPARLQQNSDHYQLALAGDAAALKWLGEVAGILPPAPDRGIAATTTQKNDAIAKYNAVLAARGGSGGGGGGTGGGAFGAQSAGLFNLSPLTLVLLIAGGTAAYLVFGKRG